VYILISTICILLIFAACGRSEEDDGLDYIPEPQDITQTLNIRMHYVGDAYFFRQAGRSMALEWEENGDIFELNIETFGAENVISEVERLNAELMAGSGPDIFCISARHNLWRLSQSGFLTDFYSLIDQDPVLNRDDFFTNVLDAFTFEGGLYAFPLRFAFRFAGINLALPQELIDRFAAHSIISDSELVAIYGDLMNLHGDEFDHLAMAHLFSFMRPIVFTSRAVGTYIDFDNRTSSLTDDGFISFLTNLTHAFRDVSAGFGWYTVNPMADFVRMRHLSSVYAFFSLDHRFNLINSLFETLPDYQYFGHHIPITDDKGRLLLNFYNNAYWSNATTLAVTSSGNQALSWEYIQHLMQVMSNPAPNDFYLFSLPIKRSLVQDTLDNVFEHAYRLPMNYMRGFMGRIQPMGDAWSESFETQVQIATERLLKYSEMPIAPFPTVPERLFEEFIEQMFLGIISPEDAAQHIHNTINLWLIE